MPLSHLSNALLPPTFDTHVHLRDGALMTAVVPTIRRGGASTVYVMPNLTPPITTPAMALAYRARLQALSPTTTFLMTLYLHPSITPATVHEAAHAGITGIKSYPAGVTTNSDSGIISYEPFYPVFAAMQDTGLVLNLHGECPSSRSAEPPISILNAEASFLPTLHTLHSLFPRLKIVLEHCTTAAAIEAVKACGPTVVGGITAHHLFLTIDDWADEPFNYCKPVAKREEDRRALVRAVVDVKSRGRFFFGSDSAPHDVRAKKGGVGSGKTAAGVFTQPYITGYVLGALEGAVESGVVKEEEVTEEVVVGFLGGWGRAFYGVDEKGGEKIRVRKGEDVVAMEVKGEDLTVVPFRRGEGVWSVEWV